MISYKDSCIILEDENNIGFNRDVQLISSRDEPSISNKFDTYARGLIITDSYNNPFIPIRPRPRLDTSNFDLGIVFKRYREIYTQLNSKILPWHFCCEMIDDRYYIFNTRPLDMKFPMTTSDALQSPYKDTWKEDTQKYFGDPIIDISECIHICIIGDSFLDVYPKIVYELIGRTCIVPTIRRERLPGIDERIFSMNIGHRFRINYLTKFIRK